MKLVELADGPLAQIRETKIGVADSIFGAIPAVSIEATGAKAFVLSQIRLIAAAVGNLENAEAQELQSLSEKQNEADSNRLARMLGSLISASD